MTWPRTLPDVLTADDVAEGYCSALDADGKQVAIGEHAGALEHFAGCADHWRKFTSKGTPPGGVMVANESGNRRAWYVPLREQETSPPEVPPVPEWTPETVSDHCRAAWAEHRCGRCRGSGAVSSGYPDYAVEDCPACEPPSTPQGEHDADEELPF